MLALYNWLDFKARPLKLEDFKNFVATLKSSDLPNPEDEWRHYADNLILAIEGGFLHTRYCVDFQLLIRISYLIRLCLKATGRGYQVGADITAARLNAILTLPILLPPRLLRGRCSENCKTPNKMLLPTVKPDAVAAGRNPCECTCDESCQKPSNFCICIKPYIGDLFLIKEELARFEAGDIADIENILAGEKKMRRHRTLTRLGVDTTETETETITSEERDHEVNEKFCLQSEVKSTVDEKVGVDAGRDRHGQIRRFGDHHAARECDGELRQIGVAEHGPILCEGYRGPLRLEVQEKVRKLQISKVIERDRGEEQALHR